MIKQADWEVTRVRRGREEAKGEKIDAAGKTVLPGLIDVQCTSPIGGLTKKTK